MTGYDLVAIVNLLEDWNDKDYGFALYKEEYELLRTANLKNTLIVVNAGNKNRRVLGKVKEILPLEEYGNNPTAQVVGVVNMAAYIKRYEDEKREEYIKNIYRALERKLKEYERLMKQLKEFESVKERNK